MDDILKISNNFIDDGIETAIEYAAQVIEAYKKECISEVKEMVLDLVGLLAYIKMPRLNESAKKLYQAGAENYG